MQSAGERILEYTTGLSTDEYQSNDIISSAVEWKLIIIGEALTQAAEIDPDILTQIADSSQFIRMQQHLMVDYDLIDDNAILAFAREMIPILLQNLQAILNQQ
jgi:uncharacterized protein with HEPN domain